MSYKRDLLAYCVWYLQDERGILEDEDTTSTEDELWTKFRALVNTRPPQEAYAEFYEKQDELLQAIIDDAGVATIRDTFQSPLNPKLHLWRGDITRLLVDAIVNAANNQLLGCWAPGHHCIDNAIHTYAGVQLREECNRIMIEQGHPEPTGQAKITDAYNLPSCRIIHTVGPIANGNPTDQHRAELASCYRSCLDCAADDECRSIAFCCISTGVFGFPQEEAAHIAVETVSAWLEEHPDVEIDVVFNVFGSLDYELYKEILAI